MEFKLSEGWHKVEEQIAKFGDLLRSIKNIEDALGNTYLKMFNEYLTPVEQNIQEAYGILTGQISYPDIRVLVKSPEEIEMEVGISGRDLWRKPSEVLNEQAKNAIELVPYFAFSELGMLHHDLDFLLIDDPSRSFDIEHLESLMNMLKSVSKNAQIIVSTQEKEKFEKPVKELFPTAKILEIGRFDPHTGPKIMGGYI
jgi:wobble nucleotide-excising tRNase